ncbi:cell division inhibitor SulA [Cellvibrio sp.]|uniref:cell division inhibitor SulA n=1 Tax=Cellvibrio sp. TaxID=1965322 RepID=UPI0039647FB0
MNRVRHLDQTVAPSSGITELVIANTSPEQAALIMPMIAFLTQSCVNRWVTWIAPQHLSREFLESFGVDTRYVRLIHCSDEASRLWITWEALAAGNSHTVISSPGKLTDKELKQLENAAYQGNCQGLLLRVR